MKIIDFEKAKERIHQRERATKHLFEQDNGALELKNNIKELAANSLYAPHRASEAQYKPHIKH